MKTVLPTKGKQQNKGTQIPSLGPCPRVTAGRGGDLGEGSGEAVWGMVNEESEMQYLDALSKMTE